MRRREISIIIKTILIFIKAFSSSSRRRNTFERKESASLRLQNGKLPPTPTPVRILATPLPFSWKMKIRKMSQTPRRTGKFPHSIFENSTIIIARREKVVWGESQTWVRNIIEIKISANTEKSSLHPSVTSSSALINYENFPFSNPKRLHPTFIFRCCFPRWNFCYIDVAWTLSIVAESWEVFSW